MPRRIPRAHGLGRDGRHGLRVVESGVARARILVVDDDPTFSAEVRRLLGEGFEVAEGGGAAVAVDASAAEASGRPFDVVLLDAGSPRGGLAALGHPALARARVIMTSDGDAS